MSRERWESSTTPSFSSLTCYSVQEEMQSEKLGWDLTEPRTWSCQGGRQEKCSLWVLGWTFYTIIWEWEDVTNSRPVSYYFRDIWLSKNKHTMKTILRLGRVDKWNWEVAELSDECAERTQQKVVQFLGLETRWLRSSLSSLINFTTRSVLVPNACLAASIHLVCLSSLTNRTKRPMQDPHSWFSQAEAAVRAA